MPSRGPHLSVRSLQALQGGRVQLRLLVRLYGLQRGVERLPPQSSVRDLASAMSCAVASPDSCVHESQQQDRLRRAVLSCCVTA